MNEYTLFKKNKETLNRHSQSFHLGSTSDCDSISPALVQIKGTTGAIERQKQDNPPKNEGFCMWWPQTIALSLSFLNDPSLVLCSASVFVTTGSIRWYLQPNQVAEVVQLRQDGTSIRAARECFL